MSRTKDKRLINVLLVAVILVAIFVVFFNLLVKTKNEYIYISFYNSVTKETSVVKSKGQYTITEDVKPQDIEGHEFIGWFYDDDYKLEVKKGTVFNSSHTIKACYSKVLVKDSQPIDSQIAKLTTNNKHITIKSVNNNKLSLSELELICKVNPYYLNLKNCLLETNEISNGMFNSYIETLYLPHNITAIKSNAFNGLYSSGLYSGSYALKEIHFNSNLTEIESYAFYGCSNLKTVIFSDNITSIGDFAFEKSGVENVSIGEKVQNFGKGVFKGLNIKIFKLNDKNMNLKFENNILYSSDYKNLYYSPFYTNQSLEINDAVENIKPYAFYSNKNIKSLKLSSKMKTVGEYAFYDCRSLKEIDFNQNKEYSIEPFAFANCLSIERLEFGLGLKEIKNNAFDGCKLLSSVSFNILTASENAQIQSIGSGAFKNCSKLISFIVPTSVNSLGDSVFENCESLQTVTLSPQIKTIKYKTFYQCINLASITSSVDIETIEDYAFAGCEKLQTIDCLYNSLTIGVASFNNCLAIENMSLNNIKIVPEIAFEGCKNLKQIQIDNVEEIKAYAFNGCGLINLTFKEKLKQFNINSFINCSNLKLTVQDNLNYEQIENAIYTKDLKSLVFYPLNETQETFNIIDELENIQCENLFLNINIKSFVATSNNPKFLTENGVLFNKDKTTIIKYPNSTTKTSIEFKTEVKTVAKYAFRNNQNITKIIFPSSIEEFEKGCLQDMQKIQSIEIPFVGQKIDQNKFIGYIFGADIFASNISYLPKTLTKVKVTDDLTIGEYQFYQAENLKTIEINKEVSEVSKYAFFECFNLQNVIFNGKISKICEYSFYNTRKLSTIEIGFDKDLVIEYNSFMNIEGNVLVLYHNNYQTVGRYLKQEFMNKFYKVYPKASRNWQIIPKS